MCIIAVKGFIWKDGLGEMGMLYRASSLLYLDLLFTCNLGSRGEFWTALRGWYDLLYPVPCTVYCVLCSMCFVLCAVCTMYCVLCSMCLVLGAECLVL